MNPLKLLNILNHLSKAVTCTGLTMPTVRLTLRKQHELNLAEHIHLKCFAKINHLLAT